MTPRSPISIAFLLSTLCIQTLHADLFSSVSAMEKIFDQEILSVVDDYIANETKKMSTMKQMTREYQVNTMEFLQKITQAHFQNPVAAYLILKKLAAIWVEIEEKVKKNQTDEDMIPKFRKTLENLDLPIPTQDDIDGAIAGLLRLEDTYNLETAQMVDGEFPGVPSLGPLSVQDCIDFGLHASTRNDSYHAILWLEEAFLQSQRDQSPLSANQMSRILENLAGPYDHQNMTPRAILLTEMLLLLEPHNTGARENLKILQAKVQAIRENGTEEQRKRLEEVSDGSIWSKSMLTYEPVSKHLNSHHQALCRGENVDEPLGLVSYYKSNTPFLRLAPLKVQIASWDPLILIFREVVSPTEAAHMIKVAHNKMSRSKVASDTDGAYVTHYRISQNAWIKDDEDEVAARISRRAADMTELDMENAEAAQVGNYGIGGHYEVHHDGGLHYYPQDQQDKWIGKRYDESKGHTTHDRIATAIFYLVQPISGGATIFPEIDLHVSPTAGDAAFWYNTMKNGYGDPLVTHAACPVLTGQKWILNKWISAVNQEFLYPCSLDKEE